MPFYYFIFIYIPSDIIQPHVIFLFLLHIKCIQIIHASRFPQVHSHTYNHCTSMSSFHSLLHANILPSTISLTLAPTLPSEKTLIYFIRTYSSSLAVLLKPSVNAFIPYYCIVSHIYFFHPSPSTFIPRFTIPFTLTSLKQIRFTDTNSPNLLHVPVS